MLLDAVYRSVGLVPPLSPKKDANIASTDKSQQTYRSPTARELLSAHVIELYESLPVSAFPKRLFTLVIDLDSVLADILADYRRELTRYYTKEMRPPDSLHIHPPPPPPATVTDRIERFYAAVREELLSNGKVTVLLVLGDLPGTGGHSLPSGSDMSTSDTSQGQQQQRSTQELLGGVGCVVRQKDFLPITPSSTPDKSDAPLSLGSGLGWWGTAPFCQTIPPLTPDGESETSSNREKRPTSPTAAVAAAFLISEGDDCRKKLSLDAYAVWYAMYYGACGTAAQFAKTCGVYLAPGAPLSSGLFAAVNLQRKTRQERRAQWVASSKRSKSEVPVPGGVAPIFVCSSNPAALFVSAPTDSVIVDLYKWLTAASFPSAAQGSNEQPKEAMDSVKITHAPATALMLGVSRASALPALYAALRCTAEAVGEDSLTEDRLDFVKADSEKEAAERQRTCELADERLAKIVDLVNAYNGLVGECFCEGLLTLLFPPPPTDAEQVRNADEATVEVTATRGTNVFPRSLLLETQRRVDRYYSLIQGLDTYAATRPQAIDPLVMQTKTSVMPHWLVTGTLLFPFQQSLLAGAGLGDHKKLREPDEEVPRAALKAAEILVPSPLSSQLFSPSSVSSCDLADADVRALQRLHAACCPTRTAMLHYGLSFARIPTAAVFASRRADGSPSCCVCGLCRVVSSSDETPRQEDLSSVCSSAKTEAEEDVCRALRLSFLDGRTLSLHSVLYIALPEDDAAAATAPWKNTVQLLFSSVALFDLLLRLPARAQIAVTALLLLQRSGALCPPLVCSASSRSSHIHTRCLVWLFHLLRVLTPSTTTRDGLYHVLCQGLLRHSALRAGLTVTWGELLCVQEALGLVTCATVLCDRSLVGGAATGVLCGADLEASLRSLGLLTPCAQHPFTRAFPTEKCDAAMNWREAHKAKEEVREEEEKGVGSNDSAETPSASAISSRLFSANALPADADVQRALDNAFMFLAPETETWALCKTFLENA